MSEQTSITWDANEAVADIAYHTNEVISIYPITPASAMGEHADAWAARGKPNVWGTVPRVVEMQSEGGAAGAVHGALQAGALTTTFTSSQGLLLMIPNMYKIAGELTPVVIHVAARSLATHALSIFCDHSDVYAARQTGWVILASGSVQEAHDLALVSHAATLETRLPFLHFFDGFRTSHEVAKTTRLSHDDIRAMLNDDAVAQHRDRALTPDRPVIRGTAQNPDVFFQAREAANPFYDATPAIVQGVMDRFAALTGRAYHLYDYHGHPEAERVIVMMGSGGEAVHETVDWMVKRGEKVGVLKVRLYRPFVADTFIRALPKTTRSIAVLDRTKEPGATGEPLYLDVVCSLHEQRYSDNPHFASLPDVVGGRYGLSSKEFTPAMIVEVYKNLTQSRPRNHFTVGIHDDVGFTSLPWDPDFDIEPDEVTRAVFWGLGADGTVGANKNSIKIIGEETENHAQGYFVYDSKKSGAVTVSHLRFGPNPIRSTYKIAKANFVGCHQWSFLDRYDVLATAAQGAVLLLNAPFETEEVWDKLPREVQATIIGKQLKLYAINAYRVARDAGMPGRINTIMQTCFFAISGVLPRDEAITRIKGAIEKDYGKKGRSIVEMNFAVVDQSLANMHAIPVPAAPTSDRLMPPLISDKAPDFVKRVTGVMIAGLGDQLPVSVFQPDGTWPLGTTKWEKRAIAEEIPIWDSSICIQCNKCSLVCPHAAIRIKVVDPALLADAPEGFRSTPMKGGPFDGQAYIVQVAPEDCTGCTLCSVVCPARDKSNPRHKSLDMLQMLEHVDAERERFDFFLSLPEADRTQVGRTVKESQLLQPLFEFSGACAGCGETPYIKLLTQLFGDRMLIANATGCSSIYGGNLPTTPYTTNADGRGPAWANSLFEDNAEFGVGFSLAADQLTARAQALLRRVSPLVGDTLSDALLAAVMTDDLAVRDQRERVEALRGALKGIESADARELEQLADYLVRKSIWIVGGDGWAYDIGYGGLDHALASGLNINILVLDTEVYSNTGGQASKATPTGAVAKFAASGKTVGKKDLGMLAVAYGNVYVAQVAFGAKDAQTVRALTEAESWNGPSLVIAYSHCIAHGYNMADALEQQRRAVLTGYWPLYRFDPRRLDEGKPGLQLDFKEPKMPLAEFAYNEARYRMLQKSDPVRARMLLNSAQEQIKERWARYDELAHSGVVHNQES